ncbi:hypothetical protein KAR91_36050, partial [Candidatus Pacearchaeota archaeon]|nr:hypothetical protein [Candidatus Pacearchaeota archaeon]
GLCYDTVLKTDPDTDMPLPYILQGTETNGVTGFQSDEKGAFWFLPAGMHDNEPTQADPNTHDIIAYYDFTDVKFHDGIQVEVMDVLFSYQILALHPYWYADIAPLMDGSGLGGNFSINRWLYVWDVSSEFSNDGNDKTSALRFHITTNYAQLFANTMNIRLLPRYVWEGTGGGIHNDFGHAVDSNGRGVPVNHPTLNEFDLFGAMGWEPKDNEIIGTGMFKFKEWIQGSHSKIMTNEFYLEIKIGNTSIHRPYIDGIEFIKYSTPQQATFGLQKGEVDVIMWSVPPDFIPDLQRDTNVSIVSSPASGFYYVAFNMRGSVVGGLNSQTATLGYKNGDPAQGDIGKPFRQAMAHLIDKKTLVYFYLQGYGVTANGPVSPLNIPWYNNSLPQYDFDIEKAKSILDAAGFVDGPDADEWRDVNLIDAGDQDELLELITLTADYDPYHSHPCWLIEANAIKAGINLMCNHQSFGTIFAKINAREFQMYKFRYMWAPIGGDPTEYLFNLFYSLNADLGQNYPGYRNAEFDKVIMAARSEMDISKRQELVKWAQGILVEDLPINTLYFRKNIEAYRRDNFIGWVSYQGSIFNYWSVMNVRSPSDKFLRTTVTVASAVSSNKTETITVTVRDQDRNVVEDAIVSISVDMGNLSVGGTNYGLECEILTNINGQAIVFFKGPFVTDKNGTRVSITVNAFKPRHDESGPKTIFILVFPSEVHFLSVVIGMKFGDLINGEESTEIDIMVKDQNHEPVDGAFVELITYPKGLILEPTNGTTENGGRLEGVVLTAPRVDSDTVYIIEVCPSKAGYKSVNGTVELIVTKDGNHYPPPPPPPFPLVEVLLLALFLAAVVATVMYIIVRKGERPKR